MQRYKVTVNNREIEVALLKKEGSHMTFSADDWTYEVDLSPILLSSVQEPLIPAHRVATRPNKTPLQCKSGEVIAPMPGIIGKIHVSVGMEVQLGAPLLVIEAMKMENTLPSPVQGTVKEILVSPGQEVSSSQVLIRF